MPSTYIASEERMNTSTPTDKTPPRDGAMSPIADTGHQARPESPKTPEDAQRIPKDDSFKTCRAAAAELSTPYTSRREGLRKTPARMNIFSGGKPFKEAASSGRKKFNSRSRKASTCQNPLANETANSNETFIKCEQEILFEGDSLEGPGSSDGPKRREAKPLAQQQLHQQQPEPQPELESEVTKTKPTRASPQMEAKKASPVKQKRSSDKKGSPLKQKRSDKKISPLKQKRPEKKANNESKQMPPPPPSTILIPKTRPAQSRDQLLKQNLRQQNQARRESQAIRNQFLTPKLPASRKPPASLMGTASRYMNPFNTSRLTRSSSFKSTAELERDYFNSLRSF